MSLGLVVKASHEKIDDHALVYWPEEDCVSVVKIYLYSLCQDGESTKFFASCTYVI